MEEREVLGRLRNLIYVEVKEVTKVSERAIFVSNGTIEGWIPRSMIGIKSEVKEKGDSGRLLIPKWLAEERGFI